jgi:hypothetical protein
MGETHGEPLRVTARLAAPSRRYTLAWRHTPRPPAPRSFPDPLGVASHPAPALLPTHLGRARLYTAAAWPHAPRPQRWRTFQLCTPCACVCAVQAVRHEQMVHLTNYCMQVQSAHCGTHEEGNCASFDDLSHAAPHVDFRGAVLPAIYALVADSLLASRRELLTGLREHGGGRRCAANARSLARRLFGCSAVSSHCCCCLPACFTPLVSPLHTSRPHPFLAPSSPLVHTPSSPLPPLSHAWPPGCVRSSASISCLRRVGGPS